MSNRSFIVLLTAAILSITALVSAQPTLDPSQTVNPATGDMGFSMMLGTIQGLNGKNIPVNLSYQAGIHLYQGASPAGLGFSYSPGSISLQQVFVNDMNTGGSTNYSYSAGEDADWGWQYWVTGIMFGIFTIVVAVLTWGQSLTLQLVVFSAAMLVVESATNYVVHKPYDYIAGAFDTPGYDAENGTGKGVVMGGNNDMPDIYNISTPFLSGQMCYRIKENDFVLRAAKGCTLPDNKATNIECLDGGHAFKITLSDGTKLVFDKVKYSRSVQASYAQRSPEPNVWNYVSSRTIIDEPSPCQWFLTKVFFNDYVDGNGDEIPGNSIAPDKGNWIQYNYDEVIQNDAMQIPNSVESSPYSTTIAYPGGVLQDLYLKSIKTPNQYADFIYSNDRLDDLWFLKADVDILGLNHDGEVAGGKAEPRHYNSINGHIGTAAYMFKSKYNTALPLHRKVLSSVVFYNNNNKVTKKIKLNTDYSRKPSSLQSYTKNSERDFLELAGNLNAGCLTLNSFDILNASNEVLGTVRFNYVPQNPPQWDKDDIGNFTDTDYGVPYYFEKKDLWGYYYPTSRNRFPWLHYNWVDPEAQAWSVNEVILPTGKSVQWVYEANRYDMSNNKRVKVGLTGAPLGGGGIRVKQVITADGTGNKATLDYFYTCDPNVLEEHTDIAMDTCNSSGYVAVHPMPYLSNAVNDYRTAMNMAYGGSYTPSKVAYEMVKVAQNYDYINHNASNGYSVYEFTSCKEYPNAGSNAEIDQSWKRGLLKYKGVYNNAHQLLNADKIEYAIQEELTNTNIDVPGAEPSATRGTIHVQSEETVNYGLTKQKKSKYATIGKGAVNIEASIPLYNYSGTTSLPKQYTLMPNDPSDWISEPIKHYDGRGDCVITHEFGNTSVLDIVALTTFMVELRNDPDREYALLMVGKDMALNATQSPFDWEFGAVRIPILDGPDINSLVTSGGLVLDDINSSGKQDAITFSMTMPYGGGPVRCWYQVFNDIKDWPLDINENNMIRYPPAYSGEPYPLDVPSNQYSRHLMEPFTLLVTGNKPFITCPGICHVTGSTSKDLLVIYISEDFHSYQMCLVSDIHPDGSYNALYNSDVINERLCSATSATNVSSKMIDYDGDGELNDVILTAAKFNGIYLEIEKEVLRNIHLDMSGRVACDRATINYPLKRAKRCKITTPILTVGAVYPESFDKPVYALLRSNGSVFAPGIIDGRVHIPFDRNGMADTVEIVNGDTSLVTIQTPAYCNYPEMLTTATTTTNVVTPVCQSEMYKKYANTYYSLASNITTWQSYRTGGNGEKYDWRPVATYGWKVPMANGVATEPIADFNFTDQLLNDATKWLLQDSITKYSISIMPIEVAKPLPGNKRLLSTVIYGHGGTRDVPGVTPPLTSTSATLPIATIRGAGYDSCAVYTGDYENDIALYPNYLDYENGWERGLDPTARPLGKTETVPLTTTAHFGERAVHIVDSYGPSKSVAFNEAKSYIFSAWLWKDAAVTPTHARLIVTFYSGIPSAQTIIGGTGSDALSITTSTTSKLFTVDINAALLQRLRSEGKLSSAAIKYVRISVGCTEPDPACDFYAEEIRFYPANALVNTTYYRTDLGLPILTIDANNKASQKVTYDGFGRPITWEKLDLSKRPGETGYATLIKGCRYGLMGDGIVLRSPLKQQFKISQEMSIEWVYEQPGKTFSIYLSHNNGPWVASGISPLIFADRGVHQYLWKSIPAITEGSYRLKIEDVSNPSVQAVSPIFTITGRQVIKPDKNSRWLQGASHQVEWLMVGATDVDILYYDGATYVPLKEHVPNVDVNGGNCELFLSKEYSPNTNAKIKIIGHYTAESDREVESDVFWVQKRPNFIMRWFMNFKN